MKFSGLLWVSKWKTFSCCFLLLTLKQSRCETKWWGCMTTTNFQHTGTACRHTTTLIDELVQYNGHGCFMLSEAVSSLICRTSVLPHPVSVLPLYTSRRLNFLRYSCMAGAILSFNPSQLLLSTLFHDAQSGLHQCVSSANSNNKHQPASLLQM